MKKEKKSTKNKIIEIKFKQANLTDFHIRIYLATLSVDSQAIKYLRKNTQQKKVYADIEVDFSLSTRSKQYCGDRARN